MGRVYYRIIIGNKSYDFIKGVENFKNKIYQYFPSEKEAIDKSNNLKLLKKRSFQRIKIPHFAFNTFKNVLSIHM